MKSVLVIISVILVILLLTAVFSGPLSDAAGISPESKLVGRWYLPGGLTELNLKKGGTFSYYNAGSNPQGGEWSVEGNQLTLAFADGTTNVLAYSVSGSKLKVTLGERTQTWHK